jgi:hypothetical protein
MSTNNKLPLIGLSVESCPQGSVLISQKAQSFRGTLKTTPEVASPNSGCYLSVSVSDSTHILTACSPAA